MLCLARPYEKLQAPRKGIYYLVGSRTEIHSHSLPVSWPRRGGAKVNAIPNLQKLCVCGTPCLKLAVSCCIFPFSLSLSFSKGNVECVLVVRKREREGPMWAYSLEILNRAPSLLSPPLSSPHKLCFLLHVSWQRMGSRRGFRFLKRFYRSTKILQNVLKTWYTTRKLALGRQ